MPCLTYHGKELHIETIPLTTIAERYGTPCYIYSRAAIERNWHTFITAFHQLSHRICYAVKANSNLAILNILTRLQAGFDIVSGGELERVLRAGGQPKQIIFSGVGKTTTEMQQAIHTGIDCFNVESESELQRLHHLAKQHHVIVNVALRVNPHVNPRTHEHITTGLSENKFGIELERVIPLCQQFKTFPALRLVGIACHIGSQLTQLDPFLQAIDRMLALYLQLKALHIPIQFLNMGGGLGICYRDESPPTINHYVAALEQKLASHPLELILEPGRAIVGTAGTLLTRVEYIKQTKQRNFAIVDAGMNDFIRPALYDAWQTILPVIERTDLVKQPYDIAGPLCESADFLGKNRLLALQTGDLLAVDSAGAYGFSMSSNYNSRCRPAEILINNNATHLIRKRETPADTWALERIIE